MPLLNNMKSWFVSSQASRHADDVQRLWHVFQLALGSDPLGDEQFLRAFDAGWGGVVTKTIGLHPVVNVVGAKAKFMRTSPEEALRVAMARQ